MRKYIVELVYTFFVIRFKPSVFPVDEIQFTILFVRFCIKRDIHKKVLHLYELEVCHVEECFRCLPVFEEDVKMVSSWQIVVWPDGEPVFIIVFDWIIIISSFFFFSIMHSLYFGYCWCSSTGIWTFIGTYYWRHVVIRIFISDLKFHFYCKGIFFKDLIFCIVVDFKWLVSEGWHSSYSYFNKRLFSLRTKNTYLFLQGVEWASILPDYRFIRSVRSACGRLHILLRRLSSF